MQFRFRREEQIEGDDKLWKMQGWSKMISPLVCRGRKSWHRADKEAVAAKRCCVDHLYFSSWRTWLKLSYVIFDGVRKKCQPDKMPTKGWHFVRTFYCGWHFVRANFWLAFCPDHLNMFWHFVRTMKKSSFDLVWVRHCTVSRFPPI